MNSGTLYPLISVTDQILLIITSLGIAWGCHGTGVDHMRQVMKEHQLVLREEFSPCIGGRRKGGAVKWKEGTSRL